MNAPAMIGQSSGHGRSHGRAPMLGGAQLIMDGTKVVHTADQIHAGFQRLGSLGRVATSARQGGQTLAKRGIQPLDKRRVEHASPFRLGQKFLSTFQTPLGHASRDLDHAPAFRVFDHGGDQEFWPDDERTSSSSTRSFDLFAERPPNAAGIRRPSVGADKEGAPGLRTPANLHQQAIRQSRIARQADHSCQPQPRGDHHGQSHPHGHAPSFHADFVRLDMHQIQARLLDDRLMKLLAVLAGSISPTRDRSFIQPVRLDDGLHRAAIRQQGHDNHDQIQRLAQSLEHRSSSSTERLFARLTPIALPLAVMNPDVTRSDLASCATRQVRAKYPRRVHRLLLFCLHENIMPMVVTIFKSLPLFHQLVGLYCLQA